MKSSFEWGPRALVPAGILAIVAFYVVALFFNWPQRGTQQIILGASHAAPAESAEGAQNAAPGSSTIVAPPLWTVLPFVLLLAGIAVLPLIHTTSHWWESNLNRFKVAAGLSL